MENENYLAKWLSGEISDKELRQNISSEDFLLYKKITKSTLKLSAPCFNQDEVFQKILNQREKKSKVISISRITKIAAVFLIGFVSYYLLNLSSDYSVSTKFSETKVLILPDDSEVTLNAKSEVSYNEKEWKKQRHINLQGQAFFKVAKGKRFDVKTLQGLISVLGTQFDVNQRDNYFKVSCYEGIVRVKVQNKVDTLYIGESISIVDGVYEKIKFSSKKSSWLLGETVFESTSIYFVFKELERQYGIKVDIKNIEKGKFSGAFTHKSLDLAFQSICLPLGWSYKKVADKHFEVYKK